MKKLFVISALLLALALPLAACDSDDKKEPAESVTETVTDVADTNADTDADTDAESDTDVDVESDTDAATEEETDAATEEVTDAATQPDETTGDVEETEPEEIDTTDYTPQFEKDAKDALAQATEIVVNSTVEQTMFMQGEAFLTQTQTTGQAMKGDNGYANVTMIQEMLGITTTTVSNSTQIKTETGYNFFTSVSTQTDEGTDARNLLITATDAEVEGAEEDMMALQAEIAFSVGHFKDVTEKTTDGVTVYTCTNIRPAAVDAYEAFASNITEAFAGATVSIDRNSVTYELSVKDGKIIGNKVTMTYNMMIQGEAIVLEQTCTSTYEYTCNDITAPTDWDYENDKDYTWDAYWEMVNGAVDA